MVMVMTPCQARKHVMLRNGGFEFDSVKQSTCCCSHDISEHLDYSDLCLAKSKEICICDRFLSKGVKVTIPKSRKLPQKEDLLEQKQENSYIQKLAKM